MSGTQHERWNDFTPASPRILVHFNSLAAPKSVESQQHNKHDCHPGLLYYNSFQRRAHLASQPDSIACSEQQVVLDLQLQPCEVAVMQARNSKRTIRVFSAEGEDITNTFDDKADFERNYAVEPGARPTRKQRLGDFFTRCGHTLRRKKVGSYTMEVWHRKHA